MVFQDPIGDAEPGADRRRRRCSWRRTPTSACPPRPDARLRACEALDRVGIPDRGARLDAYPAPVLRRHAPARRHRDRAAAPAGAHHRRRADHGARRVRSRRRSSPRCATLVRELGTAVIWISHDLGDRVRHRRRHARDVCRPRRRGRADRARCCATPRHPYTHGPARLACPSAHAPGARPAADPGLDAVAPRPAAGCAFRAALPRARRGLRARRRRRCRRRPRDAGAATTRTG